MVNQRIIDLLAATGMKRNDLAAALGVDTSTLRRWSLGNTQPPAAKLAELERIAGGGTPLQPTKQAVQPARELASFPSSALIEELARRTRGGILQDVQPSGGAKRPLRSVAFRDVEDD